MQERRRRKGAKPVDKNTLVVPHDHLHPRFSAMIRQPTIGWNAPSIEYIRNEREKSEAATVSMAVSTVVLGKLFPPLMFPTIAGASAAALYRTAMAGSIKAKHAELARAMMRFNNSGYCIVSPSFSERYPELKDLKKMSHTYSHFHVDRNGNMVFHRMTPMEARRLELQENPWVRNVGIHPWYWRQWL